MEDPREPVQYDPLRVQHSEKTVEVVEGPEHDQAPFLNNNSNNNNNKSNNGVMSRDGDDKIDDLPHHPLQPTTSNSILQTIDLGPPLTMTADSGLGGNVSNVSEMKPPGVMVVGRDLGSERNHGSQKHTPEFTRTSNPNLLDRSSANSASMHITVSDPVKRVSDHAFIPGLTASHYEYLVATTFSREQRQTEVRRRFNDFVALADVLAETQRGYFVFPRPDKDLLEGAASGRSESEFIEFRRVELERYLRKLAAHPIISQSEEFKVFLTAEGSLSSSYQWQGILPPRASFMEGVARLPRQLIGSEPLMVATTELTKNSRHSNDLFRRLRELGERMRQDDPNHVSNLPPDEVRLRTITAGVESYAEAVAHASRRAEKVLRDYEKLGMTIGDLGLALVRLGKYEDEEGSGKLGAYTELGTGARTMAANYRQSGIAAIRCSRLARSATSECITALEPLHTELALAPAIVEALKDREAALLTKQSVKEDISRRRNALRAPNALPASRVHSLQDEIAALEAASEIADGEYERIKSRNQEELQRWSKERMNEYEDMAASCERVLSTYYLRTGEVWNNSVGAAAAKGSQDAGSIVILSNHDNGNNILK